MKNTEELTPNEKRMASEKMSKLLISYSIPTIIGMMVNALYNVTDRFWVGRIEGAGADALIGVGLTLPIMNMLLGIAQLVAIGAATSISISLGKRRKEEADHILGNALSLSLIGSIVLILLGFIFLEDLLWALGANEYTIQFALPYARIIIAGCIFTQVSFTMNHCIRAVGNAKRFASAQLLGAIVNMILDPIFIFGFGWGIRGVALATIMSQMIAALWIAHYYFSAESVLKLKKKNLKPDFGIAKRIYSIGFSSFVMQTANSLVIIIVNRQLIHYGNLEFGNGDIAVGAMTVVMSISNLFLMPIIGINQGMTPIIGFNFGAKDFMRVKQALFWGVFYAVVICLIGTIVVQIFAPQLIAVFNDDPYLVAIGARGMRMHLALLIFVGLQSPCIMFFQAIGRPGRSIFLSMLRLVVILIPMTYVLPLIFGFDGIWMATPVTDAIAAIVTLWLVFLQIRKFENKSNLCQN